MATNQLTITFRGICVHFHDIVPGVPHRVVLPNASAVRFGIVTMPPSPVMGPSQMPYYLMPHLAVLGDPTDCCPPVLLNGAHVQVVNAVGPDAKWVEGDEFAIAKYVPRFAFSEEVVFGGRAACYFDIFNGTGTSVGTGNNPRSTVVTISTVGPPRIRITPFPESNMTGLPTEMKIDSGMLNVSNLDFVPPDEDAPFDFFLNYLVARNSIPTLLAERTPGLPAIPPKMTFAKVGDELISLGEAVAGVGELVGNKLQSLTELIANGGRPSDEVLRVITKMVVDNPSCSDSHYP
jgi:hypothetical protein